jgi:O-antigen ligase
MGGIFLGNAYSGRSRLLAVFVMLALVLGGGGSPNPLTEVILEGVFVCVVLAWLWLPGRRAGAEGVRPDPLAYGLIAATLVIPVVQLIPLPPSLWHALPGRGDEIAALSLIGKQSSWRPISLSPSRTFASLLAIVPPLFCFYAVTRLELHERRLVLAAVLAMAVATALLGALQLSAGGQGISFYRDHHVGWVTGFQANRNAAADVLLVGLLALAALAAPYLVGGRQRRPLALDVGPLSLLSGGIALVLLAATAMTGSRAGILLLLVAAAGSLLIFSIARSATRSLSLSWAATMLAVVVAAGLAIVYVTLSGTALFNVVARFSATDASRPAIWKDTWFALKEYWPVGFGMGGFEPAMLPAERLEVLTPSVPNRAHNDFLEIGLEAGLLGYAMVVAAIGLCLAMALRGWRAVPDMRRQIVFGLGVLIVIALHSVVDYPLRSMAVASLAGVAGGMLVRNRAAANRQAAFGTPEEVKVLA